MRGATLGTHMGVTRQPGVRSKGFSNSNARRQRNAVRGEIHQVLPSTASRETRRAYENRMSQRDYVERSVAVGRKRKMILAGALAAVVLAAALIVALVVFFQGIDARMKIEDEALAAALAQPAEEGEASYTLLAASFDASDDTDPDCLVLVRTDPQAATACAIGIPANTSVRLSDGNVHRIGEAFAHGGFSEAVTAVEDMLDIQIAHFAKTDAAGFAALVDALGGLVVDVPEAIEDPDAGSMRLPAGVQTLNGEAAVFACRANDYLISADQTRSQMQGLVAAAFFQRLAGMGEWDFYGLLDSVAGTFETDMGVRDAYGFLKGISAISFDAVHAGALPTYLSTVEGVSYQVVISEDATAMMERVRAGEAPQAPKGEAASAVDPASVSITLNNGGTVEGAGAEAKALLVAAGYQVGEVGNAAQAVYDETLVIYSDSKFEAAAEALVSTLGAGRAVWDSVHYSFSTDVLIMVGNDWQAVRDSKDLSKEGASA